MSSLACAVCGRSFPLADAPELCACGVRLYAGLARPLVQHAARVGIRLPINVK